MTMKTFVVGLAAVLIALAARPANAQTLGEVQAQIKKEDAQRESLRQEIEHLLELSGASQMAVQAATMISSQILDQLRSNPSVPSRAIDVAKQVLDEEFRKAFAAPDGLMAGIVRIYAKHFTSEDVKALVAFYETDIGKKLVATMPVLMQESMDVAQQWSTRETPRIGRVLGERLRKEGLIK
jgi:hypothetical protein